MISIALPVHDMKRSEFFLQRCLDSILEQTFDDYEVVITDNSDDDRLFKLSRTYGMKIRHSFNKRKGMAQNTNEAIKRCQGDIIKVLYMDDYFAHEDALAEIVHNFEGYWMINGTNNNKRPYYTDDIHLGNNHLGSPSALTMRNKDLLLFDEKMTWLLDCDYYKRLSSLHGEPKILPKVEIIIGEGSHQMTNILTDKEKELEADYMQNKYAEN